ncbi:GNAT family N-acetyltransferase [Virgibacillus dokdonensis]|uniref:GNAT family N-acetyltransferase n=1 Tax=Virgibacillus dokdonensis TaxID=302167 RepID=UPI00349F2340
MFGVFNEKGLVISIGKLNKDPFSNEQHIGRLKRFYVDMDYRRNGIGSILVTNIINEARKHYKILVLHTDTKQADKFYNSI